MIEYFVSKAAVIIIVLNTVIVKKVDKASVEVRQFGVAAIKATSRKIII